MKKIMMSLAGYDPKLASLCPVDDQNKYAAMGGAIIITVLMAVFGAVHLAEDITHDYFLACVFALFWGTIVLIFEYLMVNLFGTTKGKWVLLTMRILMSVALSTLLALPFILLLFKGSITQQMAEEKKVKITKIENFFQAQRAAIDTSLNQRYQLTINKQTAAIDEFEGLSINKQKGMGRIFDYKQAAFDSARIEYNRYRDEAAIQISAISKNCVKRIAEVEEYYAKDFLAQLMALLNLMKNKPIVVFQTTLVFFILLLFDLMPIILKTTSSLKSESDAYNQLVKQERLHKLNSAFASIRQSTKNQHFDSLATDMPGRSGFNSFKADASTALLILEAMNEYLNLTKDTFSGNEELQKKAEQYLTNLSEKSIGELLKQDNRVGYEDITISDEYKAYIADARALKHHHPFAANQAIVETVKNVCKDNDNEENRFIALYNWITTYIPYDKDHDSHIGYRTAIETFIAKRGICGEMSALLITMCRIAGIKADYVSVTKDVKGEVVSHACAGVTIDGVFRLADPAYHNPDIFHHTFEVKADSEVLKNYESWNNQDS